MNSRSSSLLFLLVFFLNSFSAVALDPSKRITQYRHRSWRVEDGTLPSGPTWITQAADGYLMVGLGSTGIVKFDGARFTPWSPPEFSSNDIHWVLSARAGGFWISDSRGVVHINRERISADFDSLGPVSGVMVEDADGALWLTRSVSQPGSKPLCHISDRAAHCFGAADGANFATSSSIALDGKGGVWIGTDTALVHWRSGHSQTYECAGLRTNVGQTGIEDIVPASDGSLWVGIARQGLGLQKFVDGTFRPVRLGSFDGSKFDIFKLFMDRDHNLWIGTYENGLYRIHGDKVDHFGKADGLSSDEVYEIHEDREGIIWVGTSTGIDSFADQSITTFPLSGATVSVVASRDGTVWVGSAGSLDSIRNGFVSSIGRGDSLPGEQVTSLFEDHAGELWVGVDDGLFIYEHHHFRRLPELSRHPLGMVVGITEDRDGNIWAECASRPRKLVRIRNFQVQEEFSTAQVPAGHALAADPKSGIWISTMEGDLVRIQNDSVRKYSLKLTGSTVRQIEAETDGPVLVASPNEGLVAFREGKVQRLTKANGLPCDGVFAFVHDNQESLWLETPCGYVSIAKSEMQRWLANSETVLRYGILDRFDGARPGQSDFNGASRSPDGRLWFAPYIVQSIDPNHLLFNKLPPPVHIEQVIADRKANDVDEEATAKLTLSPLIRDLEIDYTALSLLVPQKVHFRYKLDGQDHDWHDVDNRRQAFYTNLGPGRYRFHVIACNNDGVWNETGASLSFAIAPAWFQTIWFRAFCICALLLLLWALYQLRLRQLQRQFHTTIEARVDERTRIARELHDTLLQSFQGLTLHFQRARNLLPGRAAEAVETLDAALDGTEQALVESRDAIYDLRSSVAAPQALEEEIGTLGKELAAKEAKAKKQVEFRIVVEGKTRGLSPNLHAEVFRIAREALRNGFNHSQGRLIETELAYTDSLLRLRIRDDGKGIDPDERHQAEQSGHWGMRGMGERAEHLGAELEVWSEPGAGTEIELRVPASIAYEAVSSKGNWWAFWKRRKI